MNLYYYRIENKIKYNIIIYYKMDSIKITEEDLKTQLIVCNFQKNNTYDFKTLPTVKGLFEFDKIDNVYDITLQDFTYSNSQYRIYTPYNTIKINVNGSIFDPDSIDLLNTTTYYNDVLTLTIPDGNYNISQLLSTINSVIQTQALTTDWTLVANERIWTPTGTTMGIKFGLNAFVLNNNGFIEFSLYLNASSTTNHTVYCYIDQTPLSLRLGFTQSILDMENITTYRGNTYSTVRKLIAVSYPNIVFPSRYYVVSNEISNKLISSSISSKIKNNIISSIVNSNDPVDTLYFINNNLKETRLKFKPGNYLNRIDLLLVDEDGVEINNNNKEQLDITFLIRSLI